MDSGERGMNPVANFTVINPRKEYWPSRGSNQQPPVFKSALVRTELWGSAKTVCTAACIPDRHQALLTLYSIDTHQLHTVYENIVGKEEIARDEQFLLFPQRFLLNQKIVSSFINIFDVIYLFAAEVDESKIGMSGKGLSRS